MIKYLTFLFFCLVSTVALRAQDEVIRVGVQDITCARNSDAFLCESITEAIMLRLRLEESLAAAIIPADHPVLQSKMEPVDPGPSGEPELQFVVSGYLRQIDDRSSLQITVYNTLSREQRFINPKPFHVKELFPVLEEVTEELVRSIHSMTVTEAVRSTAVMCITRHPDSRDEVGPIAAELQQAVYYNLPPQYSPIELKRIARYCGEEDMARLAADLDADIVITGMVRRSGDSLTVFPAFYLPQLGRTIEPLPYATHLRGYKYYSGEDYARFINKALRALVDEEGSWSVQNLEATGERRYRDILRQLEEKKAARKLDDYESLNLASQAAELKPRAAEPYYYLGEVFRSQNNPRDAIANFDRAITLDPQFEPPYVAKGEILSGDGKYVEALETFKVANRNIGGREFKYRIGVTYYFLDSTARCVEWLEQVDRWGERQKEVDYYLSRCYFKLGSKAYGDGQFEEAIALLSKAYPITEDKYEVSSLLVKAYSDLQRFDEATRLATEGIGSGELSPSFYMDYARHLRTIKEPGLDRFSERALNEAIGVLKRYVTEYDSENAAAHQLLGSTHFRLGMLESAEKYYLRAIDLRPDYIGYRLDLAEVAIMNANPVLARETLNTCKDFQFNTTRTRGHELLVYYLGYVNALLYDLPPGDDLEKLNALMASGESRYLGWSFATFLNWLDGQTFDDNVKIRIKELTLRMEQFK